jgi:hypothetical protein
MPRIVIFASLLIVLTACSLPGSRNNSPIASEPVNVPVETSSTSRPTLPATGTPSVATSTPSADPTTVVSGTPTPAHYTLQAQLDYWGHTLAVSETIEYTNNSPDALDELHLEVEANRWAGGFNLQSLKMENGKSITNSELSGNQMIIPLPQPLQPAERLILHLSYQLFLPAIPEPSDTARPVPFGYTGRQTNLVDWYPFIPPYRPGEGWLLHNPGYFGEHQVYETADFDVQISLSQPVQDLVIAASAPAGQTAESYDYHLVNARNFAWSASHVYKVSSTTVGDTVVTSYYFPTDAWAAEQALLDTAQALELYSELFSPYPQASLSVVEADFLDGMEFSGLYFLSRGFYNLYDGTPQGYLTAIAAHETAHQWWYGQVGNDQALEPWLDEAMCTYSERIFYENIYPDLLNWWWAFRVDYYEPSGVIDGAIYDYNSFRSYRDSVYLHGAEFLEELRITIGDEAFFAFLSDYTARKTSQQATAEDFFIIVQEHTSKDLSRLREEYFTLEGE